MSTKSGQAQCGNAVLSLYRKPAKHDATAYNGFTSQCLTAGQTYSLRGIVLSAAHDPDERYIVLTVTRERTVVASDEVLRKRFGLTAMECTVARLLALGHEDRAIADTLGVSWHTARRHAEHVLKKLDVHTRSAVALKLCR